MTKTVLEVLEGALEILRDPKRWTKGSYARNTNGNSVRPHDDDAVCFCSSGALMKATASGSGETLVAALCALLDVVGSRIVRWNDAPERTHAEIIQGFEKAIAVEKSK
jgi:hypothetical protein